MTTPSQWARDALDLDVEAFANSVQFRDLDGVFDGPLLSTLPDRNLDSGRRLEPASAQITGESGRRSGSCLLEKGGSVDRSLTGAGRRASPGGPVTVVPARSSRGSMKQ